MTNEKILFETANELVETLHQFSTRVKKIEEQLQELKFGLEFSIHLETDDNGDSWYLAFEEYGSKFRIVMVCKTIDDNILKKPFTETIIETRLRFKKYLDVFIEAFIEHLKNYNEAFKR